MNLTKINYAEFSEEVKEMLDNKLEEQMEEQGVTASLNKLETLKGMFSDTLKEAMKKESDDGFFVFIIIVLTRNKCQSYH